MNFVSVFMAIFSMLGAIDLIFKNKFGLGKEFEKGFLLFGNIALSMIGMIVIAPLVGRLIMPVLDIAYQYLKIEPSIIPAMLFANDMGGAALAEAVAKSKELGDFNGMVVTAMMGCTISYTLPVALSIVEEKHHKNVLTGFLCGIVTIPIGCFLSGLLKGINPIVLFLDMLPLIIFAVIIAIGLWRVPKLCVKILGNFAYIIKILIIVGLGLGILKVLTGLEPIKNLESIDEGCRICFNACIIMSGAFPFMAIMSRLLSKPLCSLGDKLKINKTSAFGFFSSLVTSVTTFEQMKDMDEKGIVLNSAFAISAAFTFAGHLAFTLSVNESYVLFVILGKIVSGIFAIILASQIYKRLKY